MVKLFLSETEYPDAFATHDVQNQISGDKMLFFEKRLMDVLNSKNSKLKIKGIEYINLKSDFKLKQKRSGVIVKCDKSGENVLAYVFLTPESGRNVVVAQTIFPDLIDIMETYIDSPSFNLANHPVYFINMIDNKLIPSAVKRDFALLSHVGIHYAELFQHNIIDIRNIPDNITEFVNNFMSNLGLSPVNFHLKIPERKLIVQSSIEILTDDRKDFDGSKEKFFFTEILLSSIIAMKSGFQVDFKNFEDFINKFGSSFSDRNEKMRRCKTLLKYLKKIDLKKQHLEL